MLGQFSFKNYKSYKNEVMLDLYAENISEHKESLIIDKVDNEKFLPVIALYGPNGGGKSTVLDALQYLPSAILSKVLTTNAINDEIDITNNKIIPQLFDLRGKQHKFDNKSKNSPCEFSILFRIDENEFRYQLSVLNNTITEENLYMHNLNDDDWDIIFERNTDDYYLGNIVQDINIGKIKDTMPMLAAISIGFDIPVIDSIISWFLNINVLTYNNPRTDLRVLIPKDNKERQLVFKLLQNMDINIKDIRLEKDIDGNITQIYTQRHTLDGKIIEIPLQEESSGTRKLLGLLPKLIDSLQSGGVVIADEMDAKLHPKLFRYIIELFTNPETNRNGAQLLLTSHDITTMIPEVFRRDEIWFCALDGESSSVLYPLVSFKKPNGSKTRNDEAYGKRYLEGHYGADPYLKQILTWKDEYNEQ